MPALRDSRERYFRIPLKLGGTACAYHAPWQFYAMGVFDYRRKMHMDIRENLAQIGGSAFDMCPQLTLRVRSGSFAAEFCRTHQLPFVTED